MLGSNDLASGDGRLLSHFRGFSVGILHHRHNMGLRLVGPPRRTFISKQVVHTLRTGLFTILQSVLFICKRVRGAIHFPGLGLSGSIRVAGLIFSVLHGTHTLRINRTPGVIIY